MEGWLFQKWMVMATVLVSVALAWLVRK